MQAGCRLTGLLAGSRHARVHGAAYAGGSAVLKVATQATMSDPIGRARFTREGRLGLQLRHPSLVETLAQGEGWILLADLRGASGAPASSLQDVADTGTGSAIAARRLGSVAAALAYLHARGLVHRDVKPGNILLRPDGAPVLIDLGIAALLGGDDLGSDEMAGAPVWMAPEQLLGRPPQAGADVWSFASVLGCLVCGIPPFAGTTETILDRRRAGQCPDDAFLEGIGAMPDASLAALVAAGLSEDARARPPMTAFAAHLGSAGPREA